MDAKRDCATDDAITERGRRPHCPAGWIVGGEQYAGRAEDGDYCRVCSADLRSIESILEGTADGRDERRRFHGQCRDGAGVQRRHHLFCRSGQDGDLTPLYRSSTYCRGTEPAHEVSKQVLRLWRSSIRLRRNSRSRLSITVPRWGVRRPTWCKFTITCRRRRGTRESWCLWPPVPIAHCFSTSFPLRRWRLRGSRRSSSSTRCPARSSTTRHATWCSAAW